MLSRSLGMPSRREGPPSIWNTHGTSGNFFANPDASPSALYPQESNLRILDVSEHTSPHVMSGSQTPVQEWSSEWTKWQGESGVLIVGVLVYTDAPGEAVNTPCAPCTEHTHSCFILHWCIHSTLSVSSWSFSFVPTRPRQRMCGWASEESSVVGCVVGEAPTFSPGRPLTAGWIPAVSAQSRWKEKWTQTAHFDATWRGARWGRETWLVSEISQDRQPDVRSSLAREDFQRTMAQTTTTADFGSSFWQVYRVSNARLKKIRFKIEGCTCSQFPTEAVHWINEVELVESVDDFNLRHLFVVFQCQMLKNSIRRLLQPWTKFHNPSSKGEWVWRNKKARKRINNFEARNGNCERNAVVKNQGTTQRIQRILGVCWQWETNGQCSKGDNCSSRHNINAHKNNTAESFSELFNAADWGKCVEN